MKCNQCHKEIDKDSEFCIYCGNKIEKDLAKDKKDIEKNIKKKPIAELSERENVLKRKEIEEEKSTIYIKENSIAKPILITFLIISIIAVIVLSVILSGNLINIENYKEEIKSLSNSIKNLEIERDKFSYDLDKLRDDYNILKSNYKNLSTKKNTPDTTTNIETNNNIVSETTFLNKVYNLLDEYELAMNHMNTYHKEGWIFNDPNEIALEETFLVKLQELSNKLKGFSYPNSFVGERNTLISISEEINHYRYLTIECMKNNNFDCCLNNINLFNDKYSSLFNYYNSLVR